MVLALLVEELEPSELVISIFGIREGLTFRLQADAINVFNLVNFSAPNTTITSANFGKITGQANLPRVVVVYSYVSLGGEIIDVLVENGVKGIVLAGVGDGNTTDAALAALEKAAKKGVAVVRSSRTGSGLARQDPAGRRHSPRAAAAHSRSCPARCRKPCGRETSTGARARRPARS